MKVVLEWLLIAVLAVAGTYTLGRVFWKSGLHELDRYLGKKLTDYINAKKEKENGKGKEELF